MSECKKIHLGVCSEIKMHSLYAMTKFVLLRFPAFFLNQFLNFYSSFFFCYKLQDGVMLIEIDSPFYGYCLFFFSFT